MLLLSLALVVRGFPKAPPERPHTTDWFLRIVVVVFLANAILHVLFAAWMNLDMYGNITRLGALLSLLGGYAPMLYQLAICILMTVGAFLWLQGLHRRLLLRALCGAVLFVLLPQPFAQDSMHQLYDAFEHSAPQEMHETSVLEEGLEGDPLPADAAALAGLPHVCRTSAATRRRERFPASCVRHGSTRSY